MPDYSELETRIQQKETINSTTGLHYGVSSNPDIYSCWNSLSETQKNNPFWRGYIWHLLTDQFIYSKLDIDAKFQKFLDKNKNAANLDELRKTEVKKLHTDWDKTNARNWTVLKEAIEFLRNFNPLSTNMDYIIKTILNA